MTEQEIRSTLADIESELKETDATSELLNDAGVGHYLLGELEEALAYFQKAVRLKESADILFNLANTLSRLERPDEAIHTFLMVLEKNPGHIGALNNLADEYEYKDQLDKAHELFHYLTHLQPDEPLSHFNLGNFFLRQNQHIEAAKCYEEAIKKDPEFVDAYHNIAWILYKSKAYHDAMRYINKGLKISPAHNDLTDLKKTVEKSQEETAG